MENKKLIDDLIYNINNGKIVAFPTETVYALSCDANNSVAINNIYKIKNRNENKLFSVFIDINLLNDFVTYDSNLTKIVFNELENGTTVIFNKKNDEILPSIKSNTVGIRIPKHNFSRLLLKTINKPIVATSVNYSGDKSLCNYEEITRNFPQINLIIDNKFLKNSVISSKPSKIISVVNNVIEIIRE